MDYLAFIFFLFTYDQFSPNCRKVSSNSLMVTTCTFRSFLHMKLLIAINQPVVLFFFFCLSFPCTTSFFSSHLCPLMQICLNYCVITVSKLPGGRSINPAFFYIEPFQQDFFTDITMGSQNISSVCFQQDILIKKHKFSVVFPLHTFEAQQFSFSGLSLGRKQGDFFSNLKKNQK